MVIQHNTHTTCTLIDSLIQRIILWIYYSGSSLRNIEFNNNRENMVKHSFDSIMLNGPMAAVEDLPIKASTEHYHLSNVYVKAITSFTSTQRNHLEFKKGKK